MKKDFKQFELSEDILRAIQGLGYTEPSEVQEKVIPEALMNKDILVKSQTGSGKTAAFGIPLCERIEWEENHPQALILTPTRELAVQVKEDIRNIGVFKRIKGVAVFGKQPFSDQARELKGKTHVVIGTPGRVLDHIDRETLKLDKIKYFIIDEADEMLNMGFIKQVEAVIRRMPKKRVTMLFSATIPEEILDLCEKHMDNPVNIEIKAQKLITDNIEHKLYTVGNEDKMYVLNNILINEMPKTAVIFCKTKENVDNVYDELMDRGYSVNRIHGGMMQNDRLSNMDKFRKGDFRILVATDVAARGIDIDGITHVVNFDLPVEKEAYVHRIGRTGRAGAKGEAITLVTKFEDRMLNEIESYIGFSIPSGNLPTKEEVESKLEDGLKLLKSKPEVKRQKAKEINKGITKIYLNGGKKKKIRAGDIVGAVTRIEGITPEDIGIIDVQDTVSYVDILNGKGKSVIDVLSKMTIKGKKLRVEKAKGK